MADSLVIIPTYNEKENIEVILKAVLSLEKDFNVLVIDDGSPDGTDDIVERLMPNYPNRIFLLKRKGKQGLGTAYLEGFQYALDNGYEYVFEMDADFSHNPKDLIRLYEEAKKGFDVVIGSRYVPGGKIVNWPFDRLALSYGASVYVRIITWMHIKDPTAGFVCYKASALRKLNLRSIEFIGYAFQIEMKYAMKKLGMKIAEIPITFVDRIYGESKISKGIISEAVFGVLKMKWFNGNKSYLKS
ncbi:MAG: polyprenol monophosphomannose synthase [Saprospiraceae bacterium]|nr:polyprenol monophosphomannose synthase [Saprospiraceae bacterium]